ncbi:MAG: GtrA family protein [Spirochaetales bacterium]|nr:GtrA family protein [Spirochaetales bacterium]
MEPLKKKKELFRTLKYFMFAASAGLIEMGVFAILTQFSGWTYWPCYLIALIMSVLWNFTLNRKFTFKSSNNIPVAMAKVALYYAVFTPASTLLGNYLAEELLWNGYVVTIISMLINGVTEYLYQRFFVFGKSIDTNIKKPVPLDNEINSEAVTKAAGM